jgi:hypothetical protein
MRHRIGVALGLVFVFTAAGCRAGSARNDPSTATPLPDPHNHVVDVSQTGLSPESTADFEMAEVSLDADLQRENVIENPSGTFQAFTVCDPALCSSENCCQDRILVEEMQTGQVCEIQELPLRWRPFSDLVWIADNILVFDRWSGPDHGVHYVVNIQERKLLVASPFPRQLPADR